jgi:hypothetical protein
MTTKRGPLPSIWGKTPKSYNELSPEGLASKKIEKTLQSKEVIMGMAFLRPLTCDVDDPNLRESFLLGKICAELL